MGIFGIWLVFCVVVAVIASNKGRSVAGFFFLSLLLSPLIGLIVVLVAKPNRKTVEQREVATGEMRKCPYCAELVKSEAILCRYCGKDLPPQAPPVDTTMRNIDGVIIGQSVD